MVNMLLHKGVPYRLGLLMRPQGSYILKVSYITLQAWQSAGSKGQQARGEAFDVMPDFLTTRTVVRGINTPYR